MPPKKPIVVVHNIELSGIHMWFCDANKEKNSSYGKELNFRDHEFQDCNQPLLLLFFLFIISFIIILFGFFSLFFWLLMCFNILFCDYQR